MKISKNEKTLNLVQGDITEQKVDVIVNAANTRLAHGGGVAGAIASAAGAELQRESQQHPFVETGQVGITVAGDLNAKYVIHAVGPIWRGGGSGEKELLKLAIQNSLIEAEKLKMHSIAFPAISTGIYGYPIEEAAQVIISTILDEMQRLGSLNDIRIVLFTDYDFEVFSKVLSSS